MSINLKAQNDSFAVRGVLPWHNFLCGPTSWNLSDYKKYLDQCKAGGINLVAFHTYSGGGERYVNYVEPLIKIQYKNVLPEAMLDNGSSARWGYLPMKIKDYAFGTSRLFKENKGDYFGADASVTAKTQEERYNKAQALMQQVLKMAHKRSIKMAMGFEFGVAPPEYASIRTNGDMYWRGEGSLVYNPFDPDAIGILQATIDNILDTYKGIDYIWLWLNEHSMFGVDPQTALKNKLMSNWYTQNKSFFQTNNTADKIVFAGIWTYAWIRQAYTYIKKRNPQIKIVIGGWASEDQMTPVVKGLDEALPNDIIFSLQNPEQGLSDQPAVMDSIATHRKVWIMPWLEGDRSLWYIEPRVELIKRQVAKAAIAKAEGVVAIHWRTEDIRENWEAYCKQADRPGLKETTTDFYDSYCVENYGIHSIGALSHWLAVNDSVGAWRKLYAPEYFAYSPSWGRLDKNMEKRCDSTIGIIRDCLQKEHNAKLKANLEWLLNRYYFIKWMDEVGRHMQAAWELRNEVRLGKADTQKDKLHYKEAEAELEKAPLKELFTAYASQLRSRGELGILSSINQRVIGEYRQLKKFLQEANDEKRISK